MSVSHVVMCDDRSGCTVTAEAWPHMAGYRLSLRKRGWHHDPVTGADYCPLHNPIHQAAVNASKKALAATLAKEVHRDSDTQ